MQQTTWYCVENSSQRIVLSLYVQPGAKQTGLAGIHGGALKIKLAAPATEGKANTALCVFLATVFSVPLQQVTLKRGEKSRFKTVEIRQSAVRPDTLLPAE
jgi:uncharacterized protein